MSDTLRALADEYRQPAEYIAHLTSTDRDVDEPMLPEQAKMARRMLDIAAGHDWDLSAITQSSQSAGEYSLLRCTARQMASWKGIEQATAAERDGRATYVRWGRWGTTSYNHRDGVREDGVSVYPAWIMPDNSVVMDLRGIDALSEMLLDADDLWEVSGTLLATTGTDGEPLLSHVTGTPIHPAAITRILT